METYKTPLFLHAGESRGSCRMAPKFLDKQPYKGFPKLSCVISRQAINALSNWNDNAVLYHFVKGTHLFRQSKTIHTPNMNLVVLTSAVRPLNFGNSVWNSKSPNDLSVFLS